MSRTIEFKCNSCGEKFSREYGIGLMGHGTFYCRQCGRPRLVDLSGGWIPIEPCQCGGTIDEEALGTCPACGCLLSKNDSL